MRAQFVLLAAIACNAASGADTAPGHYQLSGSGTLLADPHALSGGKFTVRAILQPLDAALATQPGVQDGGRFALMAAVTATAHVCYNDTIFRDDFDGDGG